MSDPERKPVDTPAAWLRFADESPETRPPRSGPLTSRLASRGSRGPIVETGHRRGDHKGEPAPVANRRPLDRPGMQPCWVAVGTSGRRWR